LTRIRAEEQVFTIDGTPLESVGSFPYLGRAETRTDADWGALYLNLRKACYKWYKLSKLITREDANPKIFGKFYKGVVQTVLLFGSESWTFTESMMNVLKGFHHRAARRMANMMAYKGPGDKWIYPPLEEALKKAGLYTMEHYVNKQQQRIVDYCHFYKTYLDALHGGEQAAWDPSQDGVLVGSEERADEAR